MCNSVLRPALIGMKPAKVTPVYEGKSTRRSREEEESSSRTARSNARARQQGQRANGKACSFVISKKTTNTRGKRRVVKDQMVKENEKGCTKSNRPKRMKKATVVQPKICNEADAAEPKVEAGEVANPAATRIEDDAKPKVEAGEVAEPAGTHIEGVVEQKEEVVEQWRQETVWWEEYFPLCGGYGDQLCINPYWEVMSVGCFGAQEEEETWDDDIWNLRDVKEVPNP
ncbi:hypothetical protein Tsubulata_033254 [Turnera subulata]|uniref:Uncharacterized protein n=1 Tax=Turnera subulata TaxID=218843 RepID=A0A9Q0GDG0_9ROSI|nr:hypothetical protein Tsubulata_033254 [Turnera subulata]